MKELFIVFVLANIANVVIQTIKSLCTVKCGKGVAALVNAIAYGFYTKNFGQKDIKSVS